MKKIRLLGLGVVAVITQLPLTQAAFAQSTQTTLTVVHGINGEDIAAARNLPVDIQLGNSCVLKGVKYTQFSDALPVAPGAYAVQVRLSDGNCTGAVAVSANLTVAAGDQLSAVAHLSPQGTPTLSVVRNNDLLNAEGKASSTRIYNFTTVPQVRIQAILGQRTRGSSVQFPFKSRKIRFSVNQGQPISRRFGAGSYLVSFLASKGRSLLDLGQSVIVLKPNSAANIFLFGSAGGPNREPRLFLGPVDAIAQRVR